jgi:SpoVK/Ycf46/Vps4 family AAA+-type ATPase
MTTPHLSAIFTERSWADLALTERAVQQVEEIKAWLKQSTPVTRESAQKKTKLTQGYRCLFYGPPGTGKTSTAALIGKELHMPVHKIDLALVVSKYIGETEKNLELLFDRAENAGWILFFDEADALFGKRTNVRDAHDRYTNQEVSSLIKRIEDYKGLVILATNMKGNIDEAFIRRFNSIIHFTGQNSDAIC